MKCLVTGLVLLSVVTGLPAQTQSASPRETGLISVNGGDMTTLTGRVMCGYQGWFAVPTDAINRGWYHYKLGSTFAPGSCKFDLWPDMSEMGSDEKYAAPGFYTASGAQAYLFSSQNRKTVVRHFQWMQEYGIDGVFIQRFATEVRGSGLTQFNNVLENCRVGARQYGRSFAVMYDLSGLKLGQMSSVMTDWKMLVDAKKITQDSVYQYHNGKPVVAVWGIGFNDGRQYTLKECETLIDFLKNDPTYGGCTVMIGVPTHWRTLDQDAVNDSLLLTICRKADIVSPWFVGRPHTLDDIYVHTQSVVIPDIAWCKSNAKEYLPVVFPGFSWHNMKPESPMNLVPRLKGKFLWAQYYRYLAAGSTMIYQAMFDEIDEGTAIFKCTNDPPVGLSTFVDYEGQPSDTYLWLVGQGGRMLRKEIPLSENIPTRGATKVKKQGREGSQGFNLHQNYPNPFSARGGSAFGRNLTTAISYQLSAPDGAEGAADTFVTLKIFDVRGKSIATLVRQAQREGHYTVTWDGLDELGASVPSGVYLCCLQSGTYRVSKKMLLIR